MNGKKVNLAFLISIILYIASSFGLAYLFPQITENIICGNFVVEMVMLLPGLMFVLFSGEKLPEFLHFKKIKITTLLAVIPFTMFALPVISLLNLLTQFWVKNEAVSMMESSQIAEMPFLLVWFVVGLFAPFCEETICRGIYYRGYRRGGSAFAAMLLSSLLFGMMHMNLNQIVYTIGVGILSVLLMEATGSLWSSIVYHACINSSQVAVIYMMLKTDPAAYSTANEMMTVDMLVSSIAVYLILAAITLPVVWALLVWMSGREGRSGVLPSVWKDRKNKKDKLITIPLVIALILCIIVMNLGTIVSFAVTICRSAGIIP